MQIVDINMIRHLEARFNKPVAQIKESDLSLLTNLTIVGDENQKLDLSILDYTLNLKELVIRNAVLTMSDLEIIGKCKLISLEFYKCVFDDEEGLEQFRNIENLMFYNCCMTSYEFLSKYSNLKEFKVINPYDDTTFNLEVLSSNKNLTYLVLDRVVLDNFKVIVGFNKLEYISLLDTTIPLNYGKYFDDLTNLRKVVVASRYLEYVPLQIKYKLVDNDKMFAVEYINDLID